MKTAKKPTFFQCYLDNQIVLKYLSDEQAGKLWKMLFDFANFDIKPEIEDDNALAIAFAIMSQQIERDFDKYSEKCEKNRTNASKRKRPLATVCDGCQEEKEDIEEEQKEENNEEYEQIKEEEERMSACVEQRSTSDTDVCEIIDYLNQRLSTNYSPHTKKTKELIKGWLSRGYTLNDFKIVIDGRIKAWENSEKMRQFLRPETLFCDKFENYLNTEKQSGGMQSLRYLDGEDVSAFRKKILYSE